MRESKKNACNDFVSIAGVSCSLSIVENPVVQNQLLAVPKKIIDKQCVIILRPKIGFLRPYTKEEKSGVFI